MRSTVSRQLWVIKGSRAATESRARTLVQDLAPKDVLWVADAPGATPPRRVSTLLGRSYDAVIIDQHDGTDANVLGQCHGFIWGGGALILRRSSELPASRFEQRLERFLPSDDPQAPLSSPQRRPRSTKQQDEVVARLRAAFDTSKPSVVTLTAGRGRGKSSALGRALAQTDPTKRVVLTAREPAATAEVIRFAGARKLPFVDVFELALGPTRPPFDILIVDEAAQVPVPILRRLVSRYGSKTIAMATTTQGYEGTGRGFTLRFVDSLRRQSAVDLEDLTLTDPIRWPANDSLEATVFNALALDAALSNPDDGPYEAVWLDRDLLASERGEETLRQAFGLLVQAHYRTQPSDLKALLDAPNVRVAALVTSGFNVVAANMVALEGPLDPQTSRDVVTGRHRLVGHALLDALIAHLGHIEAGDMRVARSVRLAVHPLLRRRGLATQLTEFVQGSLDVDMFGTLFGADVGVIAFRRTLGYELVRLSASRGQRTGEPSVVMVRPVSRQAQELLVTLRRMLARQLTLQLELLRADDELLMSTDLLASLGEGVAQVAALTEAEVLQGVTSYAFGPRTFESCAAEVSRFVTSRVAALDAIEANAAAVIRHRVMGKRGWSRTVILCGLPSHRAAMRALRRGVRQLLELSD